MALNGIGNRRVRYHEIIMNTEFIIVLLYLTPLGPTAKDYWEFYQRIYNYLSTYSFPFEVCGKLNELKYSNASVKGMSVQLKRNGVIVPIVFIVANLYKGVT